MAIQFNRRDLLKSGALAGGALALPGLLTESLGAAVAEAAGVIQLSML